jgi:hypothetical protein
MSVAPSQLPLDLTFRPALGRDDFLVGPCNAEAMAWIDRYPDWPTDSAVLCGAEASGKSHLLAVWAGATETIYAVANAHANDRAEPQYYVAVSTTMLFAWSISGFILPGAASLLTEFLGSKAFMYVAIAISAAYAVFVIYRMARREAVPVEEQEAYEPRAAQVPYSPELYAPVTEDDVDQEKLD